jgi:hypothetical protein
LAEVTAPNSTNRYTKELTFFSFGDFAVQGFNKQESSDQDDGNEN